MVAEKTQISACWRLRQPRFESDVVNPDLATSPWSGHRYFAYDLVAFQEPTLIVELGTHYGCSFFTFAQAIKDLKIGASLYAVDTWEGDPHAGYYGEEVFQIFQKTTENHFSDVSIRALRKPFDSALEDIADNSVSLLHIDGCHTYEAARHDFEAWFKKLAPESVVLFHDVDPSSNYGSASYWSEIRCNYPSFEFLDHSFGLGVLFPKGDACYQRAIDSGLGRWLNYYRYKSLAELYDRQLTEANSLIEKRWRVIKNMEGMIADRDQAISKMDNMIAERDQAISKMDNLIAERDQAISKMDNMIAERDKKIELLESKRAPLTKLLGKLSLTRGNFA